MVGLYTQKIIDDVVSQLKGGGYAIKKENDTISCFNDDGEEILSAIKKSDGDWITTIKDGIFSGSNEDESNQST